MRFLVEESDQYAEETERQANLKNLDDIQKRGGATYSRMAAQVADVIEKYSVAVDNWAKIIENNPGKYQSNKLDRYLGTHQGLGEAFLAKVIDKLAGKEECERRQGFNYTEGMEIDIKKEGDNKAVYVSFEKDLSNGEKYMFQSLIPREVLDEIIEEGKK